jgi:hypothetical protein
LLGVCRCSCLLQPACCEGFPLPFLWHSGCPALFAMCLFCCYCLLFRVFFLFFPGWRSVCPGGYADLAQGCLWEYHILLSSPCVGVFPSRLFFSFYQKKTEIQICFFTMLAPKNLNLSLYI